MSLEEDIDRRFPDKEVATAVRCVMKYKEAFAQNCHLNKRILQYQHEINDTEFPFSLMEFLYARTDIEKDFTPKMMHDLIIMGSDHGYGGLHCFRRFHALL